MYILKINFFIYHTILLNEMNAVQRCWQITDLVKLIGTFKHEIEHNMDIENLNNNFCLQHLISIIFFLKFDNGVIKYNATNRERMRIQVCKCNPNITVVQFDLFEKRKRSSYYNDSIFLNNDKEPVANQRLLSEWILNDSLVLPFFKCIGDIV